VKKEAQLFCFLANKLELSHRFAEKVPQKNHKKLRVVSCNYLISFSSLELKPGKEKEF